MSSNSFADKLSVPINEQSQPPLMLVEHEPFSGIYIDLFRLTLETAGIQYEFIKVPKIRARVMFENGEVVLSCCGNPNWRTRAKEQQVQLFSNSFYSTKDVYIFPSDKSFEIKSVSSLSDKLVALKRGYNYRGEKRFGKKAHLSTQSALLEFVAKGRADVGIINEDIARHWLTSNKNQIILGPAHDVADLHIRVHKKRADLLPRINHAIKQLIKSGQRDKIVNSYLSK